MHIYLCKRFDKQGYLEEKIFRIAENKEDVNKWLDDYEIEGHWQIQLCDSEDKNEDLQSWMEENIR